MAQYPFSNPKAAYYTARRMLTVRGRETALWRCDRYIVSGYGAGAGFWHIVREWLAGLPA